MTINNRCLGIITFWSSAEDGGDLKLQAQKFLKDFNRAEKTKEIYKSHLRFFIEWCHTKNIYFTTEITVAILGEYRNFVRTKQISNDVKKNRINHIDVFLRWLAQNGILKATIKFTKEETEAEAFWKQTSELVLLAKKHLEKMKYSYAKKTIAYDKNSLRHFIKWCEERGINSVAQITSNVTEIYQNQLTRARCKKNGKNISATYQKNQLKGIKLFCQWLKKNDYLDETILFDYPKVPRRLPGKVLSYKEVKKILEQPDTTTAIGIRDRAILEILYSTGIRQGELLNLQIDDINIENRTVHVREGKGGKDRIIPIGKQALKWMIIYTEKIRETCLPEKGEKALFLQKSGKALSENRLHKAVKNHIKKAGIKQKGSCHMFRHAMATEMLERGAEIRYIQEILGHSQLETTEIYTKVSIARLKDIHKKTHPAGMEPRKNIEIIKELEEK